ncbi:MAG: DNA-directed RNA polymerase subunit L [Candidatus Aenigmatarchaeota archaeon]
MDLKVLEKKKSKLIVEVRGASYTLLNVLREKAWEAGAKQATYKIEHPYLARPKIVIQAKEPKKVLKAAAQRVADEAKEFDRVFSRALKR